VSPTPTTGNPKVFPTSRVVSMINAGPVVGSPPPSKILFPSQPPPPRPDQVQPKNSQIPVKSSQPSAKTTQPSAKTTQPSAKTTQPSVSLTMSDPGLKMTENDKPLSSPGQTALRSIKSSTTPSRPPISQKPTVQPSGFTIQDQIMSELTNRMSPPQGSPSILLPHQVEEPEEETKGTLRIPKDSVKRYQADAETIDRSFSASEYPTGLQSNRPPSPDPPRFLSPPRQRLTADQPIFTSLSGKSSRPATKEMQRATRIISPEPKSVGISRPNRPSPANANSPLHRTLRPQYSWTYESRLLSSSNLFFPSPSFYSSLDWI
jgi:hypothetical protein